MVITTMTILRQEVSSIIHISDAILLSAGSFTSVLKRKLRNPHAGRRTVGDGTSS